MSEKGHWENIYQTKPSNEVSWYSPRLYKSLELVQGLALSKHAAIIDIGGGASTLPDDLLKQGFTDVTVLDISACALKLSKERLADKAAQITWLETDVATAQLTPNHYDLWHDRAVFHFLTNAADRKSYVDTLKRSLRPGGHVLIATFGPGGPLKCSGLEIVRYSDKSLEKELGDAFSLKKNFLDTHKTPFNTTQEFLYCLFQKNNGNNGE
jgi:ubiquinone/menaquinone biosynthesis C-methylase UbiE